MVNKLAPKALHTVTYATSKNKETRKQVTKDFVWRGEARKSIIVPTGFIFDGASIPRWATSIIGVTSFTEGVVQAAVIHDWLYTAKMFSKKKSDTIFYEILLNQEVKARRARLMYYAVKFFGGKAWKNKKTWEYYVRPIKVSRNL